MSRAEGKVGLRERQDLVNAWQNLKTLEHLGTEPELHRVLAEAIGKSLRIREAQAAQRAGTPPAATTPFS